MGSGTGFKKLLPTITITAVCVTAQLTSHTFTFYSQCGAAGHLLYHFSHANIFHLALNLLALFSFVPRTSTCMVAYIAATVASYLPFMGMDAPTCGLSAFVFAAYARKYYFWRMPVWRLLAANVALALVPWFNWKIHISAFLLSYLMWMAYDYLRVFAHERRA